MQARMPPQKVVSKSTTSAATSLALAASCSKFTTTVLVAVGIRTNWRILRRRPFHRRVFEVVVAQVFDFLAEADGLFDGPYAVGVDADVVGGDGGGEGSEVFEFDIGVEDAGF